MTDKIEERYAELNQMTRGFFKLINRRNSELGAELRAASKPKSLLPEGWSIEESVHWKYFIRYKDRIKVEVRSPEFSTSKCEEVLWRLLGDIHAQENQQ